MSMVVVMVMIMILFEEKGGGGLERLVIRGRRDRGEGRCWMGWGRKEW